jgi:hypothetical protein
MAITSNATAIVFNDATVQTTAYTGAGTAVIPTGTVMLFFQAAAPTGWTQVTTQNNKALRVVSGTGGVAGGTTGFTSVFTNQTVSTTISTSISGTTGGTTLSESQLASHTHTVYGGEGGQPGLSPATASPSNSTGSTGGNASHTHSFSGSGSGSGTSSAVTLNVQYIDIILASKN